MQKWEYKTIVRSRGWDKPKRGGLLGCAYMAATDWDLDPNSFLKELGDDGWELVAVTPRSSVLGGTGEVDYAGFISQELWVFKRPKS